MKNISLYNGNGMRCALSNICFMHNCDVIELEVGLRLTKTAKKMCAVAKEMTQLEWTIFSDMEDEVILRRIDNLGNKNYLRATK